MGALAHFPADVHPVDVQWDTPSQVAKNAAQDARRGAPLDQKEVEKLIVANYPGLRTLMGQKAGDPQVGADLLNDAICTTWEKWLAGKIGRTDQIAGYVFQVAMNLLRNHRRAAGERADLRAPPAALETLEAGSDPTTDSSSIHLAKAVRKLLEGMDSPRDRALLKRFYLDEEDKASICNELGLSPLQFDKVLHRARKRLREIFDSQGLRPRDFYSFLLMVV
jgi:RNA polymerase sigma-70 factor (ECF subfamily)